MGIEYIEIVFFYTGKLYKAHIGHLTYFEIYISGGRWKIVKDKTREPELTKYGTKELKLKKGGNIDT